MSPELIEARIWCHIAAMRLAAALTMAGRNPLLTHSGARTGPGAVSSWPWPRLPAVPFRPPASGRGDDGRSPRRT